MAGFCSKIESRLNPNQSSQRSCDVIFVFQIKIHSATADVSGQLFVGYIVGEASHDTVALQIEVVEGSISCFSRAGRGKAQAPTVKIETV
jgi:hypothetical protein